jgi:hypothetical protein
VFLVTDHRSLVLRSKPSVPADSRVTFFPKPKKVTKERFALRLALLARDGRCIDIRLLLLIKMRSDFVFAAELWWLLLLGAGAVVATGRRVENQTMNTECSRDLSYRGGPGCLNSQFQFYKWIEPSLVMPPLSEAVS